MHWPTVPTWLRRWRVWLNPIPLVVTLMLLIFGWLLVFGDQGLLMLRQLHRTQAQLEAKAVQQTEHLRHLQEETKRLEDPAYLEPIIRQELGYVRPGETVYQFTDE